MTMAIVTATAVSAQKSNKENMIVVSSVQTDKDNGYSGYPANRCGIKFNIRLSGVTKIELESVDGNTLAGKANIKENARGNATAELTEGVSSIITFETSDKSGFTPGKDYYISTFISPPCLVTFMADTGFLFTGTGLWQITLEFIRPLRWGHS